MINRRARRERGEKEKEQEKNLRELSLFADVLPSWSEFQGEIKKFVVIREIRG